MRAGAVLALALALLGLARPAYADTELRKLFPRSASVEVQGSAGELARLELPAEVLAACRADLSDLRLLDLAGTQVPFVIDRGSAAGNVTASGTARSSAPPRAVLRRVPAEVLGVKQHEARSEHAPNVTEELYELRSPPPPPAGGAWQLVAHTAAPSFVRQIVLQSGTLAKPAAELGAASLFRLRDGHGERVSLPLPQLPAARFLVRLTGEASVALEPRWVFEAVELLPPPRVASVPLALREQRSEGSLQLFELLRPSGIVPSALRIETSTHAFERHVVVHDRGQGSQLGSLATGYVFRLPSAAAGGRAGHLEELELPLAPASGQWLEVSVENGDSPALEAASFSALIHAPSLLFSLPGNAALQLYFGGGRSSAPRYDLARLLPPHASPGTARQGESVARLGELRDNPAFDRTPVLGFALHAGAPVDQQPYARQRQLDITSSPDGLARIALAAADVAALRPDLADLRVVDGSGQQWPFLLEQARRSELLTLQPGEASGAKRSRRALPLPIAPLVPSELLLEPLDSYFDRAYRITGKTESGERIELASGRLLRSQGESGPLELQLSSARVVSLELEVEDGDNAPLNWRLARARVPVPDLYLLAPPGKYRLLLGNPAASAPRYDIERARDLVLSVASQEQTLGPLLDNPGFRASARLAAGEGALGAAMWGALALAVVVLGALTFRLARQRDSS